MSPSSSLSRGTGARARRQTPRAGQLAAQPARFLAVPYWVLGITRRYRAVPLPGSGFTAYLPAPFRTIHTYTYGPDGRINPVPTTRQG